MATFRSEGAMGVTFLAQIRRDAKSKSAICDHFQQKKCHPWPFLWSEIDAAFI